MVRIVLDAKIEIPEIDENIDHIINIEMEKELKNISNNLARKIQKIISEYGKLRIYNEGA
jgi:DNA polymerase/3'-5' exonuclease PolX